MQQALHILVVEDDRVTRIAMDRLIEALGFTVTLAINGEEGLRALRAEPVDVVLMDLRMPIMDGLVTARAIRNGEAGASATNIPIIALTASHDVDDIREALGAGMDDHLSKPVDVKALEAKILRIAGR